MDTTNNEQPTTKESAPAKRAFVFGPNDLRNEGRDIMRWHVFVPNETDFEDVLKAESWSNIASRLSPLDRITVTSESGKFTGELIVISSGHLWARVETLFYKELGQSESVNPGAEYVAEWVSNRYKYGIKRVSDGAWLQKELPDLAAANAALAAQMNEFRKVG